MTDDEYRRRVLYMERYVNRLAFLCPQTCRAEYGRETWTHHAWATIHFLGEVIDSDLYGEPRPSPATGIAHLDADLRRHLEYLERRWAMDF